MTYYTTIFQKDINDLLQKVNQRMCKLITVVPIINQGFIAIIEDIPLKRKEVEK